MKKLLIIIIVLSFGLIGCKQEDLSESANVAKEYLEDKGYKILSYDKQGEQYVLTKSVLKRDLFYSRVWNLPGNDPEPYMNQTIIVERFTVKNHPLDRHENGDLKAKGKVHLQVFVVDGKVVGGISTPSYPARLGMVGIGYPLDGEIE